MRDHRPARPQLSVGIAGAGVGGLAAAALLAERGHAVEVFDQFDRPRPVGSGLVIQPVGQQVLGALGCLDSARTRGRLLGEILGTSRETGRRVLYGRYGRGRPEDRGLAIHRAALFDCLLGASEARGIGIAPACRVVARDGQRFVFEDGRRSAAFDLLVDASGSRSLLTPMRARPLKYGALWGVVDWVQDAGFSEQRLTQRYSGASRMMGILPIGTLPGEAAPRAAIFWSLPSTDHEGWRARGLDAWLNDCRELWPEADPFFGQIDRTERMTMAHYGHGTLFRPAGDGIVHVGDAAHCTSPQLGQGANMALLDALALARALDRHPRPDTLADAGRAYVQARRGHVLAYQAMSALFTPQYQGDSRALAALRDHVLYPMSRVPPIPAILSRLVTGRLVPPLAGLPG